jgi:hypothetical protein
MEPYIVFEVNVLFYGKTTMLDTMLKIKSENGYGLEIINFLPGQQTS